MIYLDNAATTRTKPEVVYEAYNDYLRDIGVSPGRGSYSIGIEASRMLYKTRCVVGKYFGLKEPEKVVFTKNSTEAINLFFTGFLNKGDHVIVSCYEHNAVLRPLHNLQERGIIEYSIVDRDDLLLPPETLFEKYVQNNTKLLAMTLASNLTGRIIFREDVYKYFSHKGIATFMDSSQGAGFLDINMTKQGVDYLAFTGHKDLLAIPGVGGLCCNRELQLIPLIQGGTGIHGENYINPQIFPEGLEAGTLNMPAIWSLHESIEFLNRNKEIIIKKEMNVFNYLIERIDSFDDLILYDDDLVRVPVMCFNVNGKTSDVIVRELDKHGICVRGGIHCAILAHEALNTINTGAVRVSLGFKNNNADIDELIAAIEGCV